MRNVLMLLITNSYEYTNNSMNNEQNNKGTKDQFQMADLRFQNEKIIPRSGIWLRQINHKSKIINLLYSYISNNS